MNYTEIIKLLDAGYSRDEIMAMNAAPSEDPAEPAPEPAPEPAQAADTMTEAMKEMKEMFSELRKEVTAMNILNSSMPAEQTEEDAIAKIINPFNRDK